MSELPKPILCIFALAIGLIPPLCLLVLIASGAARNLEDSMIFAACW